MKRILFLLLLTVSVYGQNPSRFAKIQITGNSNSGTATKVNVQEANGEVNTQTINTGFNKNIGLGGSDVVGATTLLNQYSTTPVDWTATAFNSGQVVFYGGKQWIAKMATVAGDVPSVSSKWEEITFEALANKTVTVDQTIIDGSTNAVSSNAVFDGLALKSNIGHTHVASQITDLSKASVGLGNVDNTSDLSKPLSTATINALATKFPTPTGLTTNYIPKWNGSGFVNSNVFDNGTNIGIDVASSSGSNSSDGFRIATGLMGLNLGADSTNNYSWISSSLGGVGLRALVLQPLGGRVLINKTNDDLTNQLQVNGTISASPATTANQVVVKSQLDAVAARPYKVFTALVTQTGIGSPSVVVLENTLGISGAMSRNAVGHYGGSFLTNQVYNKVACFVTSNSSGIVVASYCSPSGAGYWIDTASVSGGVLTPYDGALNNATLEIRVYN